MAILNLFIRHYRIILVLGQKKQHFLRLYGKTERNIFVSFGLATEDFEELPLRSTA